MQKVEGSNPFSRFNKKTLHPQGFVVSGNVLAVPPR